MTSVSQFITKLVYVGTVDVENDFHYLGHDRKNHVSVFHNILHTASTSSIKTSLEFIT